MARKAKAATTVKETFQCYQCPKVFDTFDQLSAHQRGEHAPVSAAPPGSSFFQPGPPRAEVPGWPSGGNNAPSVTATAVPFDGPINADDYAANQFLKGSDVPAGTNEVRVRVKQFVKIQNARSPLIVQIEPTLGKEYLPLNKTNIGAIAKIIGKDLRLLINRTLVLIAYPVNNPSTGQMGRGLFVARVE